MEPAVVNGYGRHAEDLPHEQVIIALKVKIPYPCHSFRVLQCQHTF